MTRSSDPNATPATVSVAFVDPEGSVIAVAAILGKTLMEAAVEADVQGILADCGGGCSCGTCHVILSPEDFDRLGEPNLLESGILDFADAAGEYSRLSCQIDVTETLDGMCFRVGQ